MKGAGILFSGMTPEIDWEDRFNEWSDSHYIPVRVAAPGVVGARRYRDAERANYLTVFELKNGDALGTEEFAAINDHPNTESRWMMANMADDFSYAGIEISDQRRDDLTIDPLDAPILYAVFFSVPDDRADEFNAWYTEEHVPMLLKSKDWLMCRRFLIEDGEPQPWTHLALSYIADMSAFESPERDAARSTEWREKLAAEPWFQSSNLVFRRYTKGP